MKNIDSFGVNEGWVVLECLAKVINEVPVSANLYLACSGGRDSVALAYACVLLCRTKTIERLPILIHINHNLQALNETWANKVKDFACQHNLTCHVVSVRVDGDDENAARNARYQAFFEVMNDGDVMLLAHHANDQAETMLMRLIYGAGLFGLNGIKPTQLKTQHQKNVTLLRPWLAITRDEITEFCHRYGLEYVDDPTNETADNIRGLLRQKIVPTLTDINPKAIENLVKSARHLQQITPFIEDAINHALIQVTVCGHEYCKKLNVVTFGQVHGAIRPLVLQRFIQQNEILPCSERLVTDIGELISRHGNDHDSQLFWQGNQHSYVFVRYDDVLYRYRADFWLALQGEFVVQDGLFVSQINPDIRLLISNTTCQLQKMDKHTKIKVRNHRLSGKKLYQTLRIMPWLRPHLWRRDDGIVSLGESWQV